MHYEVRIPEAVASELLEDPEFVKPVIVRGAASQTAEVILTVLNTSAAVVTLAQGKDIFGKVLSALRRHEPASTEPILIEVKTADGSSLTFDLSDDQAVSAVSQMIGRD